MKKYKNLLIIGSTLAFLLPTATVVACKKPQINKPTTSTTGTQTDNPTVSDSGTQTENPSKSDSGTQTENPSKSDGSSQTETPSKSENGTQTDNPSKSDSGTQTENPSTSEGGTQTQPDVSNPNASEQSIKQLHEVLNDFNALNNTFATKASKTLATSFTLALDLTETQYKNAANTSEVEVQKQIAQAKASFNSLCNDLITQFYDKLINLPLNNTKYSLNLDALTQNNNDLAQNYLKNTQEFLNVISKWENQITLQQNNFRIMQQAVDNIRAGNKLASSNSLPRYQMTNASFQGNLGKLLIKNVAWNQTLTSSDTKYNELVSQYQTAINRINQAWATELNNFATLQNNINAQIQATSEKKYESISEALGVLKDQILGFNPNMLTLGQLQDLYANYNLQYQEILKNKAAIDANDSSNETNFNWGSVPLPKKPDDQITHQDLVQMWTDLIANRISTYTMGDRNISSDRFMNAYWDWINTQWMNYPYFGPNSDTMSTYLKGFKTKPGIPQGEVKMPDGKYVANTPLLINDTTWYIGGGSLENAYAADWLKPGTSRENLQRFLENGLANIKQGMSDWDKVFAIYNYICQYMNYGTRSLSFAGTINNGQGVCKDYATAYVFLLNAAGVKAIPWKSGFAAGAQQHMVAWISLPVDENNNPTAHSDKYLWFDSDVTNAGLGGINKTYPKSYNFNVFRNIVTSPAASQFEKQTTKSPIRYTFNLFEGVPYNVPWMNHTVAANANEFYPAESTLLGLGLKKDDRLPDSNFFASNLYYYNNDWYFVSLNHSEFQINKQNFFSTQTLQADLNLPSEIKTLISNAAIYFYKKLANVNSANAVQLFGYEDNLIFIARDSATSLSANSYFIIYNLKTNKYQKVLIPNSKNNVVQNFYMVDNKLYYKFVSEQNHHLIKNDITDFLNQNPYELNSGDLYNQAMISKILLNLNPTGNSVYQLPAEIKNSSLQTLNGYIQASKNNNLTSVQVKADIAKINEINQEVKQIVNKDAGKLIWIRNLPSEFTDEKSVYDGYGMKFNPILISDPQQIDYGNTSFKANLYYSEQKLQPNEAGWKLILENQFYNDLKITSKILPNPVGYYYLAIYADGHEDNKTISNVMHYTLTTNSQVIAQPEKLIVNREPNSTNYDANQANWWLDPIHIYGSYNVGDTNAKGTVSFIFINKQGEKKVLQTYNIDSTNQNVSVDYSVDNTPQNQGIYYLETNLTDTTTGIVYKLYSRINFIFSHEDVENFNFGLWDKLTQMV
ncbi:transglutaminase domain-containing protein [Mycoplasma seminis]|uniref:Transglutaminase domain-containing protein n=1 Tax=Mycoplasma seminis TaxID=512749 RepID=A0ABY9H9N7_9MOLU|nr:transglutaminase domain-containing protein [Mycoplasma seminis]WLP85297.1 transglutaminase domain-containing protein [Mycoplasma seminis]